MSLCSDLVSRCDGNDTDGPDTADPKPVPALRPNPVPVLGPKPGPLLAPPGSAGIAARAKSLWITAVSARNP